MDRARGRWRAELSGHVSGPALAFGVLMIARRTQRPLPAAWDGHASLISTAGDCGSQAVAVRAARELSEVEPSLAAPRILCIAPTARAPCDESPRLKRNADVRIAPGEPRRDWRLARGAVASVLPNGPARAAGWLGFRVPSAERRDRSRAGPRLDPSPTRLARAHGQRSNQGPYTRSAWRPTRFGL